LPHDKHIALIQFITDYPSLIITTDDLLKKKRINAPSTNSNNKCCAKTSKGIQCSRQKQSDQQYCGTHISDQQRPHGEISLNDISQPISSNTIKICSIDINGINYFIDENNNIYHTSDILNKNKDPRIIAKLDNSDNDNNNIIFLNA